MEQLISFETAKLAKEKDYDWKTQLRYQGDSETIVGGAAYNHNDPQEQILWNVELYSAPTQSLLQKWLREKHKVHIEIYCNASGFGWILTKLNGTTINEIEDDNFYDSFEQSLEVGLIKALKLI